MMVDLGDFELELDVEEDREHDILQEDGEEFSKPRKSIYDLTVLSSDVVDSAMKFFHQFDNDEDGLLTPAELELVFDKLDLSENEVFQEVLAEMVDGPVSGGIVDLDEFLTITRMVTASNDPDDHETRLRKAFRSFDKDGNGVLDVSELHNVLNMLGNKYSDEEVKRVFSEMDKNRDGTVDYAEFVDFLASRKEKD